jgi:hypothetical protein
VSSGKKWESLHTSKQGLGLWSKNRIEVINQEVIGRKAKARNGERVTNRNGGLGKMWSNASFHWWRGRIHWMLSKGANKAEW